MFLIGIHWPDFLEAVNILKPSVILIQNSDKETHGESARKEQQKEPGGNAECRCAGQGR